MKLYIANCTRQRQEVWYRVPEVSQPRQQQIEIGCQILIAGDLNGPQVDSIVQQLSLFGMIPVEEVSKTKNFSGLCYSIDKPIRLDKVEMLVERNDDVLTERGVELRKAAALVVSEKLTQSTENLAMKGIKSDHRATDVVILEEEHSDGTDAPFAEALRVVPDVQRQRPVTRPKAKRRG